LAESRQGFTWVERKVLDKEWTKFKKTQKRRELLSLITNEVVNPTSKDKRGFATASALNQQVRLDMQIQQRLADQYRQYVDPRALYGIYK
jgi:hypothetical protein